MRNLDNLFYAFGANLRSDGCRLRKVAGWNLCGADAPFGKRTVRAAGSFVTVRHGQQVRIRVLHLGQRFRGFNHSPQASIIEAVGCGASRAPAKGCAHRDDVVLFFHILVDGVVGEAREGKASAGEKHFGFVSGRQSLDAIKDVARLFPG